jgi:hypothetical protein
MTEEETFMKNWELMQQRIENYNRWEEWMYGENGVAVEVIDLDDAEELQQEAERE